MFTWVETHQAWEKLPRMKEFLAPVGRQLETIRFIMAEFKKTALSKSVSLHTRLLAAQEAEKLANLDDFYNVIFKLFSEIAGATFLHMQYNRHPPPEMTSKALKEHLKDSKGLLNTMGTADSVRAQEVRRELALAQRTHDRKVAEVVKSNKVLEQKKLQAIKAVETPTGQCSSKAYMAAIEHVELYRLSS